MAKVLSLSINEGSIRPRPMDVSWGLREQSSITTVADVGGALGGTFFNFETVDAEGVVTERYAWFDVDNGDVDPAPAGKTGVEVDITSGDSAAAVATALQAALDALDDVNASVASDVVTLSNEYFGAVEDIEDGSAATGFTLAVSEAGFGGVLGGTTGGVELSATPDLVPVLADQLGTTLLDEVVTGQNAEISMTLLEIDSEKLSLILGQGVGDEFTPSGGTKLVGTGESKRFQNMKQYSGELILKPSGASDNSENFHFWKSYPTPESITFQGDALNELSIVFKVFRDSTKNSAVNLFAFGDGTQLT